MKSGRVTFPEYKDCTDEELRASAEEFLKLRTFTRQNHCSMGISIVNLLLNPSEDISPNRRRRALMILELILTELEPQSRDQERIELVR